MNAAERRTSRPRLALVVTVGLVLAGALGTAVMFRAPRRETRTLERPNPLSAVFEASASQTRLCLTKEIWATIEAGGGTRVTFMWSTAAQGFPHEVFADPANAGDVFLQSEDAHPLSEVYFANGEPLPYIVNLHVHIAPISERQTSVDVRAKDYEVITGKELTPLGHGWWRNVYQPVPPTTIDEYRILKVIAACLGKDTLPPTIVP